MLEDAAIRVGAGNDAVDDGSGVLNYKYSSNM